MNKAGVSSVLWTVGKGNKLSFYSIQRPLLKEKKKNLDPKLGFVFQLESLTETALKDNLLL